MCYILPGLFYLRLMGMKPVNGTVLACLLMVAIGCFVMPTALIFVFIPMDQCSPMQVPSQPPVNGSAWI